MAAPRGRSMNDPGKLLAAAGIVLVIAASACLLLPSALQAENMNRFAKTR